MIRPRARQRPPSIFEGWRYLIIDGYVDEPAAFGVPPYISPNVRSLAGGLVSGGASTDSIGYMTIDQWRDLRGNGWSVRSLPHIDDVILLAGCVVPGKYLRGTPVSLREASEMISSLKGPEMVVCGPAAEHFRTSGASIVTEDLGVLGENLASMGRPVSRKRTATEWDNHLETGAFIITRHPDFPSPLIAELETTSGCPRYISGGCSFCCEPRKGPMTSRAPEALEREVALLASYGLENVRVGGQSDLISYGSGEIGRSEVPAPDPGRVRELMNGIRKALYDGVGIDRALIAGRRPGIDTGIMHTDNANPAVIADHPDLAKQALEAIVENVTSGSVLAFGLESTDPEVKARNNLNSTPEQTISAIELTAAVGGARGPNGMPVLLPGINFLGGLPGQTRESFEGDIRFLKDIVDRKLPLRRVNIRAARFDSGTGGAKDMIGDLGLEAAFRSFREKVRSDLDPALLGRLLPEGTVLRGVLVEAQVGRVHFGRQIGSYPVLVGMEHSAKVGSFLDIAVSEVSSRSVTGFRTPFHIGSASFGDLRSIPGIGKKRAASIFRDPPKDRQGLISRLEGAPKWVFDHIVL
ncbi:MAG: radical SAM protein [Candidatus Thermoplasmatota archaeon]|jgi:radical SAM superfamily enzyme with C-terminal helix-hairpin-helix motif|nr:radical SAM protein [Candidatus Thermoplasmatota archaeon]